MRELNLIDTITRINSFVNHFNKFTHSKGYLATWELRYDDEEKPILFKFYITLDDTFALGYEVSIEAIKLLYDPYLTISDEFNLMVLKLANAKHIQRDIAERNGD